MTDSSQDLVFEVEGAERATDGSPVVVLLHGRGADRHDLRGLAPHLPTGTALVTPQAPHPGAPWGYGPGWAWYRYVAEDRVVPETLSDSLSRLERFMTALPEQLGFRPGRVVLGGFSQGGTTSLAYALTHPRAVDGVAVLSGFLVNAPDVVPVTSEALEDVPVFWGHGLFDPAIPHALGTRGRLRLDGLGVRLETFDQPMGHQVSLEELGALRAWMEDLGDG